MGCTSGKSSHCEPVFNSSEFKADLKVLERLKLNTKGACILYEVFNKILSGDRKTISQVELLDYSDLFLFDLNDKWDQPLSPADVQAMFYEIYGEVEINSDPHAQ
eukprot:gene20372-23140_t